MNRCCAYLSYCSSTHAKYDCLLSSVPEINWWCYEVKRWWASYLALLCKQQYYHHITWFSPYHWIKSRTSPARPVHPSSSTISNKQTNVPFNFEQTCDRYTANNRKKFNFFIFTVHYGTLGYASPPPEYGRRNGLYFGTKITSTIH